MPLVLRSKRVVLEVFEEDKKGPMDAKPCTLQRLLLDLEETGHTDATVNCHDLTRPSSSDSTLVLCDLIFVYIHTAVICCSLKFHLR